MGFKDSFLYYMPLGSLYKARKELDKLALPEDFKKSYVSIAVGDDFVKFLTGSITTMLAVSDQPELAALTGLLYVYAGHISSLQAKSMRNAEKIFTLDSIV